MAAPRQALSREDALKEIAAGDPRPLLVLRECSVCNKTDDALLSREVDNERTLILARLFRCVKLPVDVVEPDHPYNTLFPSNDAEHLFVAAHDGSSKLPLESDTSRADLWDAMSRALADAYVKESNVIYREVISTLDALDRAERDLADGKARLSTLMETPRVDQYKVKRVEADVEALAVKAREARQRIDQAYQVPLKSAAAPERVSEKVAR